LSSLVVFHRSTSPAPRLGPMSGFERLVAPQTLSARDRSSPHGSGVNDIALKRRNTNMIRVVGRRREPSGPHLESPFLRTKFCGATTLRTVRMPAASLLAVVVILQGSLICTAAQIRGRQSVACFAPTCTHNRNASHPGCCKSLPHPVDLQVSRSQPNRGFDFFSTAMMRCPARLGFTAKPVKRLSVTSERPPPLLPLDVLCSLQI
jgi:hypothetical protein